MADLDRAARRLIAWGQQRLLPLAAGAMRDPAGGYYEALDGTGMPDFTARRRVRVQPRQACAFAQAARAGLMPADAARAASDHAMAYLARAAVPPAGLAEAGAAHLLAPDGQIVDARRDTYDHAFIVLAGAERAQAFGTGRDMAEAALAFLDAQCAEGDGTYREGVPPGLPRRQNPHMHLFEAFLALHAAGDAHALARAGRILDLFDRTIFDRDAGVVREFFSADFSPAPAGYNLVEPGHMMEWAFLLEAFAAAGGPSRAADVDMLFERAEAIGLDPASGFLADVVDVAAPAPPEPGRLWVQTEYLRALLNRAASDRAHARDAAARLIERLFDTYLAHPVPGAFADRLDAAHRPVPAPIMTSTVYHLVGVIVAAARFV